MCPSFSCCLGRSAGPLPTLLYYLSRLLLASGSPRTENLSAGQRRRLPARLDELWHRWHLALSSRQLSPWLGPGQGVYGFMAQLERRCCRQSLRGLVSVQEALLGPNRRRWRRLLRRRRRQAARQAVLARW